jgi:hypothetical protein
VPLGVSHLATVILRYDPSFRSFSSWTDPFPKDVSPINFIFLFINQQFD